MKWQTLIPALGMAAGFALTPASSQAVLLGVDPAPATIAFGGSGMIDFDQASGTVTISGSPTSLFSVSPFITGEILGTSADDIKDVTITFQVNGSGAMVPNDTNVPDLVINGSIDTDGDGAANYSGVLLTAEVTQFGFLNGVSGSGDSFDLRLNNIGGSLAYLYTGQDLAVNVISEVSAEYVTPFGGTFAENWRAQAKGTIGSVTPVSGGGGCKLKLVAKCSVDGGPYQDKCRIKVTRSPKHWERCEYSHGGHIFHKSKYGMHYDSIPAWAANYPSTSVNFKYTVTNNGQNPVSDILIDDSFDTPVTGYPTSLAVDGSFSIIRSMNLNEGIENDVTVFGAYGGGECGASDTVTVKDKLRDRKKHDDDDFRDKGHR